MRKMFNLMVAAIMMMATSAWGANAASSIVAGKYYLQNVATGLYLNNGSSWGTHAIVNDVGLEFELETEDGGDVMIKNNGFFLSPDSDTHINVWVDYRTEHYWSFQKLSEGIYRIGVNNDGNLTAGSDSIVNIESCTDENAQWKLVTLEDRLKVLNTATRENPVDVSRFRDIIRTSERGRVRLYAGDLKILRDRYPYVFSTGGTQSTAFPCFIWGGYG